MDLLDALVPYLKAGLENNEFCAWAVAGPLTEEEASRHEDAIRQWQKMVTLLEYPDVAEALEHGYATGGYQGALRDLVKRLEKIKERAPDATEAFFMASLYSSLGERDRAFAWLDKSYVEHTGLEPNFSRKVIPLPLFDGLYTSGKIVDPPHPILGRGAR